MLVSHVRGPRSRRVKGPSGDLAMRGSWWACVHRPESNASSPTDSRRNSGKISHLQEPQPPSLFHLSPIRGDNTDPWTQSDEARRALVTVSQALIIPVPLLFAFGAREAQRGLWKQYGQEAPRGGQTCSPHPRTTGCSP